MHARRVRFGAFEADLRSGELRKHGMKIKLQDQPFQILAMLLERPSEIVTREELRHKLWPADTFVDFDVGLNAAIKRLRDALGDSAESPRYIETLPRRGYRFVAAAERIEDLPIQSKHLTVLQPEKLWIAVGSLATLLVVFFGLNFGGLRQRLLRTNAATKVQSIAVLPLENLSGDPAQEYFADGMTEALITDLGKIGQLRVISRTSVMKYKGTKKSLREIAGELQVDGLVEGTVARSGDRVRITANLVQASPEKHLWADSFERELRDVLALQDDVSRAIANGIQIRLTPQEQARLASTHRVNPEAYEAYLEGRYFWEKLWPLGGPKANEYFELAVEKDPAWALPYSGLADSYLMAGVNSAIPNEFCTKAKATALNAVEKDDTAAETHTILGEVEFWCEWDWASADRDLRRAIEVNPSFAQAHSSYSRYLLAMGRTNEALAESKRAVELDPLSLEIRWDRWLPFYYTGQYVAAEEQCRKIQEIDPTNNLGPLYCGDVALAKGDDWQAIRELQESVSLSEGKNPRAVAHLGYAYAVAGRTADAQAALAQLKEMSTRQYVHPVLVARVCAGLGQRQEAFEWLEAGYRVRSRDLLELKYDPRLASLRTDPRFVDLLRRIGLPP
jgi:TolB-like protein/DNA-binding winged helix-turn-helix (wHTH) protein/Tfp pilus assembly protein PilF